MFALATAPVWNFAKAEASALENPLKFGGNEGENGVTELILAIVNIFQIVAVPIIVFFIIYGGFMYVVARGNPETTQKATKIIMYAVIGAVIILGAQVISDIVADTATSF